MGDAEMTWANMTVKEALIALGDTTVGTVLGVVSSIFVLYVAVGIGLFALDWWRRAR
jgi:hypothetical protein